MNGKGSMQRAVNREIFEENYDRIFSPSLMPVEKECKYCGNLFARGEGIHIANAIGGELLCPKCSSSYVVDYKGVS